MSNEQRAAGRTTSGADMNSQMWTLDGECLGRPGMDARSIAAAKGPRGDGVFTSRADARDAARTVNDREGRRAVVVVRWLQGVAT